MATLTIKKLPDDVYARLKSSAATNRQSISAEAIVRLEESLRITRSSVDSNSASPSRIGEEETACSLGTKSFAHAESEIDELLREARHWSRADVDDTVSDALRAYIARMKRLSLLDLAGRIDLDPDYDYKAARRAR